MFLLINALDCLKDKVWGLKVLSTNVWLQEKVGNHYHK
jgi:hypothetical protein